MIKYTANYARTNHNFVIQNLDTTNRVLDEELLAILCVLKNLLMRGCPTLMSKYLQEKLGEKHLQEDFEQQFLFISNQPPIWVDTIMGDKDKNYYPAKDFFDAIPIDFGEYRFVQPLLVPEIEINEIIGIDNDNFINQRVDFYLPQAKLVIEIDGQQHKINDSQRSKDKERDAHLKSKSIITIRIDTVDFKNKTKVYYNKIDDIINRLKIRLFLI